MAIGMMATTAAKDTFGEGKGRYRKEGTVAQLPHGGFQCRRRHCAEQIDAAHSINDTGKYAAGQSAEQQGKLSQKAL